MLRLLQWLFVGHVHKWKTIKTEEHTIYRRPDHVEIAAEGTRYHQQCEHCGIVKKRDLI